MKDQLIIFLVYKNSDELLDKLKAREFIANKSSTYDFSTLYSNLLHNLIKDNFFDLNERTFQGENSPYLACNNRMHFFTTEQPKISCMVSSKVMRCPDLFVGHLVV